MDDLPDSPAFATLPSTQMCWQALQAGRIQHPHDAQLSVKELKNMVGCEGEIFSNRVLHYAISLHGQSSTGSSSAVGSLPWWTHLVCPPSSLPTVQLISNGQSLHALSALIPTLAAARPYKRILPLPTGSSTIAFRSSLTLSMLVILVLLIFCSALTGSIVAAQAIGQGGMGKGFTHTFCLCVGVQCTCMHAHTASPLLYIQSQYIQSECDS